MVQESQPAPAEGRLIQRSLAHLSDGTLRQKLASLVITDRATTAELLRHLAEFETRRLHAKDGFPSLFEYCVRRLRFSEDMALKRIRVARAARGCPALLEALADGRLHLTGAVLLARHLKPDWESLLAAATHKTKNEIELLVAERFPQPDVPTLVRAIPAPAPPPLIVARQAEPPQKAPGAPSLPAPDRSREVVPEPVDQSSNHACAATPAAAVSASEVTPEPPPVRTPPTRLAPLAPGRYLLQTTIGQSTHDKLHRLQNLLGPQVPSGDVAQVLERAFDALLEKLEKAGTPPPTGRGDRRGPVPTRAASRPRSAARCRRATAGAAPT